MSLVEQEEILTRILIFLKNTKQFFGKKILYYYSSDKKNTSGMYCKRNIEYL